jgi:CheY-like chemotaxis protein
VVWALGLFALGFVGRHLHGRMREREAAEAEQRRLEQQLLRAHRLEALGRLSGGIAHDFNNLLTPILGHAQLALAELPAESAAREDLEAIEFAATRARALTRRFLSFGRQEGLKPEPVDLAELLDEMAGFLRRLLGEEIDVRVRAERGGPRALADRSQLELALVNLALNARDAMPGGGTLHLSAGTREAKAGEGPAGGWAVLEVRDTGRGMDEQVKARLFEPFFTTKGPGGGTGLGLATIHAAVRKLGGFVEVESAPGRGATFRLLLPVTGEPGSRLPAGAAVPPRGSEAVLVVEDDEGVRRLATTVLAELGYRVRSLPSPAEALALPPDEARFDLLVSDVSMPGMTGPELWRRLREGSPGSRVLFMSGYPGRVSLDGGRLLTKPFTPHELGQAVREVLDAPAAAPAARAG